MLSSAAASFRADIQMIVHYRYICHLRSFPESDFSKRVRFVSLSRRFQVHKAQTRTSQLIQRGKPSLNEQTRQRLCKLRKRMLGPRVCTYTIANQNERRVLTCLSKQWRVQMDSSIPLITIVASTRALRCSRRSTYQTQI